MSSLLPGQWPTSARPSGSTSHHLPPTFSVRKKPVAFNFGPPAQPPKRSACGIPGELDESSAVSRIAAAFRSSTEWTLPRQSVKLPCPKPSTHGRNESAFSCTAPPRPSDETSVKFDTPNAETLMASTADASPVKAHASPNAHDNITNKLDSFFHMAVNLSHDAMPRHNHTDLKNIKFAKQARRPPCFW